MDISLIGCGDKDEDSRSNDAGDSNNSNGIIVEDMGSVSDMSNSKVGVDASSTCTITLAPVEVGSGSYQVFEKETGNEITGDTALPKGTVLEMVATPDAGYAIDLLYAASEGLFGLAPYHSLPATSYEFPVVDNITLGATFMLEEDSLGYEVYSNIKYGETPEKHLIYDVVVPSGLNSGELLPVVFVVHGGGWTSGDPSIMIQMARQIAKTGKYIVCLMNYRFLGTYDGNTTPYNVNQQIEDVFGAMAHFMNLEPEKYHADVTKFVVTGDSAGGHLSACIGTMFDMIGTAGFDGTNFEFWPTGLQEEDVAKFKAQYIAGIKAMAPNYGIFDILAFLEFPMRSEARVDRCRAM